MRLIPVIGAVALGALLILVGAFGARWLSPPDADGTVELVQEPAVAPMDSGFHAHIDLAALRELMAVLPAQQRAQILDDADNFSKFVEQETVNQAVLAAAYANGADRNEAIQVLMQRAGQRVLAEAYLNQVVRGNLDPDFPSDAQVREAYDKNPDAFRVPRRMHIWQIFLPFADGADAAARKQTGDLARRLVGAAPLARPRGRVRLRGRGRGGPRHGRWRGGPSPGRLRRLQGGRARRPLLPEPLGPRRGDSRGRDARARR